jgi:hypothetical protein
LDAYKNKEYKETPLLSKFDEIASIVAESNGNDMFKA